MDGRYAPVLAPGGMRIAMAHKRFKLEGMHP